MTKRFYSLDFARGLAAIGIVVFHFFGPSVEAFKALFFFVDFFFVLSGFVLARSIQEIKNRGSLRIFIFHRALRLFPMALAGISYVISIQLIVNLRDLVLHNSIQKGIDLSPATLVLNILLLQVFSTHSQLLLFPLWSLSAEWLTNLTYAFSRMATRRMEMYLIPIGLVLTILHLSNNLQGDLDSVVGSMGRCIYGFGVGIFIHNRYVRGRQVDRIKFSTFLVLLLSFLLYLSYFLVGMNFLLILPLGFGVCILLMASESKNLSSRYLKVSKFLGKHSYGIYVWHVPMANSITLVVKNIYPDSQLAHSQLLHFVLTLLLSAFASQIVISLIEAPLRRKALKYL